MVDDILFGLGMGGGGWRLAAGGWVVRSIR